MNLTLKDSLENLQTGLSLDLNHFAPVLVLCLTLIFLLLVRLIPRLTNIAVPGFFLLAVACAVLGPLQNADPRDPPIGTICSSVLGLGVLAVLFAYYLKASRMHLGLMAAAGTFIALQLQLMWWQPINVDTGDATNVWRANTGLFFSGLLICDSLTIFSFIFLMACTFMVIILSLLTGIPDEEDSADFYVLLLGATVGMCIMASANHLLMLFLGVEMASVPSYVLAGFMKGKRQGSEAALKYVVYGGGASGVMLYGISLLAGKFGTGYFPDVAYGFAATLKSLQHGGVAESDPALLLGVLFVLVGIAFKVSAVPFHFWCPDVFEGAPAEVAGFLSVASKGAALAMLGRFGLNLANLEKAIPEPDAWLHAAAYLGPPIGFIAALTTTFGNLAAYSQTNMKRLLAYSTIAHAGFMLMGVATFRAEGMSAVLFYLAAYTFMNIGAFAIVAFIRNQTGSEELSSYRGLIQRSPIMAITLCIFMFSLLGLPPLVGFAAKFQIFWVLFDAGRIYATSAPMLSNTMYALIVVGGLNTVVSLFYYVKVVKVMTIESPDAEPATRPAGPAWLQGVSVVYSVTLALAVLIFGCVLLDPLMTASYQGMEGFREAGKSMPRLFRDKFAPPNRLDKFGKQ